MSELKKNVSRRGVRQGGLDVFGKVFSSLWEGTLVGKGDEQLVFVYLISYSDREGFVDRAPELIAAQTGIGMERTLAALSVLESPDEHSRNRDLEGRRLERIDPNRSWGWRIVSYEKYRKIRDENQRRDQTREAMERHRARKRRGMGGPIRTEAGPERPEEEPLPPEFVPLEGPVGPARHGGRRRAKREEEAESFPAFWDSYPRKVGRRAAARAFVSALGRHADVDGDDLVAAAGAFAKRVKFENREERFVPHPTTWLNQDRFMEEFADDEKTQG